MHVVLCLKTEYNEAELTWKADVKNNNKKTTTTDFLQWLKKTELYSELLQAITENSYGIILDFILAGVFRA